MNMPSSHANDTQKTSELEQKYELLVIESDRRYRAYQQLGVLHAEMLLDQPASWRKFIIDVQYKNSIHPDVLSDIKVFLMCAEMQSQVKGVAA